MILQADEIARRSAYRASRPTEYRLVAASWVCCLGTVALLEAQHRLGVQHFAAVPFIVLLFTMALCAVAALCFGLRRIVRGPRRRSGALVCAWAIVPLLFWVLSGAYAASCWSRRQKPNNLLMQTARRAGASVMSAELALRYPLRVERRRFIMFHRGVRRPEADADKMDAYLTDLERRYHHSVRDPIYWVRGTLLGQSGLSDYGLALATEDLSPPVTATGGTADDLADTDRHEAAHAVMHQWQTPRSDPPTFLEEGWAEANGNYRLDLRAAAADLLRLEQAGQVPKRGTMLASLLGADSYYRDDGDVYPCGAFITIYLIDRYGPDKFLELYSTIHPQSAGKDVARVLGTDMAALERDMWQKADRFSSSRH